MSLHQAEFTRLDERFSFTIDVAAAAGNAHLASYYTETDDGLAQSWQAERVWCNPPYADVEPWVRKAHAESGARSIVMLLPADTGSTWWQAYVEPYRELGAIRVEFLPGRLAHLDDDGRPAAGLAAQCLIIWEGRTS